VRATAGIRATFIVVEHEPQHARLVRDGALGGMGLDALWNDDWHHSAMVAATGRDEAYYADYRGSAAEFVAAAKFGFLYQGQWYSWQRKRRGAPARDLAPTRFVHFLQNHDQVANSFRGERLHELTSPAQLRALTALLLLGPQTPMLFQGQEFAASSPFLFFADHRPGLIELVRRGRATFLAQFESLARPEIAPALPDPGDPASFLRSKLDHGERVHRPQVVALHRDLLALRRSDPVIGGVTARQVDGAVLADRAFVLRYTSAAEGDRLLLVNLGPVLHLTILPEPLLAPPQDTSWTLRWTSEDPAYGGLGTPEISRTMQDWTVPGGCALLFTPAPDDRAETSPMDHHA
jgi:maltooligosyltrehalose trehalohydrolase